MTRSKSEICLHFNTATYRRLPLITADFEADLYAVMTDQAIHLGCQTLAIGGTPDHIHLVLKMPCKRAPSDLMQHIKGASSAWARRTLRPAAPLSAESFGWQDNFAAFSLSRSHLRLAVAYVENQKRHHAVGDLRPEWEENDEEV